MGNIEQSYDYANQLQNNSQAAHQAHQGRIKGDVAAGAIFIGLSHYLGNRKRKKMGLPQEPMANIVGIPMAIGLGWLLWWVPVLLYMFLATYIFHIHLIALAVTLGIFVMLFRIWKKSRGRKYAAYYTNKAHEDKWSGAVRHPANIHAPGSDEWLSQTSDRVRKNLFGH